MSYVPVCVRVVVVVDGGGTDKGQDLSMMHVSARRKVGEGGVGETDKVKDLSMPRVCQPGRGEERM